MPAHLGGSTNPSSQVNCDPLEHQHLSYQINGLAPSDTVNVTLRLTFEGVVPETQTLQNLSLPATIGSCTKATDAGQIQVCADANILYAEIEIEAPGGLSGAMTGPPRSGCQIEAQNIELKALDE
jgi:hypothetical protein